MRRSTSGRLREPHLMATTMILMLLACRCGQDSPQSAADVLASVIRSESVAAAADAYQEMRARPDRFRFDLRELTDLGYQLLRENRISGAVEVLSINAREFPDSADAWDSLGEVYMYVGDAEAARSHYAKSLELDPDNGNARKKLRNLVSYMVALARETTAASRHEAGAQTGICGPYFGQDPPGVTAHVFAPGIISIRGGLEYGCCFSPDGRECYLTRNVGKMNGLMLYCRLEAGPPRKKCPSRSETPTSIPTSPRPATG